MRVNPIIIVAAIASALLIALQAIGVLDAPWYVLISPFLAWAALWLLTFPLRFLVWVLERHDRKKQHGPRLRGRR